MPVSLMARCARRKGALVGMLTALVSAAAVAPCLQVAASARSHSSHASPASTSGNTPVASSTPTAPTAPPAPPPASAAGRRDWLISADGTLDTAVGVYTDCSGAAPVPQNMAAIDTCVKGRVYFVGHNAGVFTPLMHMGVGSLITWYDDRGVAHVFKVVDVHDTAGAQPMVAPQQRSIVAQFQTCATPSGAVDRILDAVRA